MSAIQLYKFIKHVYPWLLKLYNLITIIDLKVQYTKNSHSVFVLSNCCCIPED